MIKITIIGCGYVGMSLAVLLGERNNIIIYDIDPSKIKLINNNQSSINDSLIEEYLNKKSLNIIGTQEKKIAFGDSDFYIIAIPTDYDEEKGYFDTLQLEKIIEEIHSFDKNGNIIIKSTIPIGFTNKIRKKLNTDKVFFSPEFLREDNALYDNLNPSRIIVGPVSNIAKKFAEILRDASESKNPNILLMDADEAESVKLFSNTYLAMRVAFFNELDNFSISRELNTSNIIEGIGLDPRIGNHYNNPSFGYGGYCLPKDSKQLLSSFKDIPQNLISAIIQSNFTRKKFITDLLKKKDVETIGFYRLLAKSNSTNFRASAISDLITQLKDTKKEILIYEPLLEGKQYKGIIPMNSLKDFIDKSELIISNRLTEEIEPFSYKVFSRDIFRNH